MNADSNQNCLKLLGELFTEIINNQRNRQDAQSLQLLREYYVAEIATTKKKWQQEYERERARRKEAEKLAQALSEEVQRFKIEQGKQEMKIEAIKCENRRLYESDKQNQRVIKQLNEAASRHPSQSPV
jgi:hypothetical protein